MHYVGVDLHKRFLVVCVEDEHGHRKDTGRFDCGALSGSLKR